MDKVRPISDLQAHSKAIVDEVRLTGEPVVITQRGRPAAMLVNYEEYAGLLATVEELREPDWRERLAEAEADSRARRGTSLTQVKRSRRRHGAR